MGLFNNFFGGGSNNISTTPAPATNSNVAVLNLEKGGLLDLNKYSTTLSKVRLAAGWDVNNSYGSNYDLDICAYLLKGNSISEIVYYGEKKHKGIYLDGDNLTGSGEGDDENIYIDFNKLDPAIDRIVTAIVIYQGESRRQYFSKINNAYVRLVDECENINKEICRYNLTSDGGTNTACVVAELTKGTDGGWTFKAVGDYSKDSISTLKKKVRK